MAKPSASQALNVGTADLLSFELDLCDGVRRNYIDAAIRAARRDLSVGISSMTHPTRGVVLSVLPRCNLEVVVSHSRLSSFWPRPLRCCVDAALGSGLALRSHCASDIGPRRVGTLLIELHNGGLQLEIFLFWQAMFSISAFANSACCTAHYR